MEPVPTSLFEDNLEHLVRIGYIKICPDENMNLMLSLSPEGKQWVEDNVLCIPKTPEPPKKEKRSSLRVKTERKFYRPGAGVDGKWVDNPTSPSEEANLDLDLINKEIRVMESRQVDVSNTYMNQQGDIWLTGANDEEDMPITKNEHGMYVENLEYDSDETREMTEEEVLEYEREDDEGVVHTVEENDGGAKTVVETVEDDDENDGVF